MAARFLATAIHSTTAAGETSAPHSDLNRRVFSLIGGFRLILAMALVLVAVFQPDPPLLGAQHPILFIANACAYSLLAVIIALILRGDRWRTRPIAWTQLLVDITCITLAVYSSGGVGSGLEALLVVFVVASGMLLTGPGSYLAAALGALAVLAEQSLSFLQGVSSAAEFLPAGVTGAIMLMFAIAIQPFVRWVAESEALARQRSIDLRNLGQLNEYIIQNLREAILVVDERREIRLTNQAAAEQLGLPQLRPGDQLSTAAPEIFRLLREWQENAAGSPT